MKVVNQFVVYVLFFLILVMALIILCLGFMYVIKVILEELYDVKFKELFHEKRETMERVFKRRTPRD